MTSKTRHIIPLAVLVLLAGCQEMEAPENNIPSIVSAASEVDGTSASLSAVITRASDCVFLLSRDADLTSPERIAASASGKASSGPVTYTASLSGLPYETTYYYALEATDGRISIRGNVESFTTGQRPYIEQKIELNIVSITPGDMLSDNMPAAIYYPDSDEWQDITVIRGNSGDDSIRWTTDPRVTLDSRDVRLYVWTDGHFQREGSGFGFYWDFMCGASNIVNNENPDASIVLASFFRPMSVVIKNAGGEGFAVSQCKLSWKSDPALPEQSPLAISGTYDMLTGEISGIKDREELLQSFVSPNNYAAPGETLTASWSVLPATIRKGSLSVHVSMTDGAEFDFDNPSITVSDEDSSCVVTVNVVWEPNKTATLKLAKLNNYDYGESLNAAIYHKRTGEWTDFQILYQWDMYTGNGNYVIEPEVTLDNEDHIVNVWGWYLIERDGNYLPFNKDNRVSVYGRSNPVSANRPSATIDVSKPLTEMRYTLKNVGHDNIPVKTATLEGLDEDGENFLCEEGKIDLISGEFADCSYVHSVSSSVWTSNGYIKPNQSSSAYFVLVPVNTTPKELKLRIGLENDEELVYDIPVDGKLVWEAGEYYEYTIEMNTDIPVTAISLSPDVVSIQEGDAYQLTASVLPEGASAASVLWESLDEEIATVDDTGLVLAVKIGTAKIRAYSPWDNSCEAFCAVTVTPITISAVDLGLKVRWANMNVGASKPAEYGDYFAWGETKPKSTYDNTTYKWFSSGYTASKYTSKDKKTVLDLADDAANANWGGNWRMPTKEEWQDLADNCTWKSETINGVSGYRATSKMPGYTGNSVFFPCQGYISDSSLRIESSALYWSSSLDTSGNSNYAYYFWCPSNLYDGRPRYWGLPVRPVCSEVIQASSITLDSSSMILREGVTGKLTATILPKNATYNSIIWSSSKESVASVDNNGNVTAYSEGETTITAYSADRTQFATCVVTVRNDASELTVIDLGLSVKWANMNIGATLPEEYGNYFAWGETAPKNEYSWSSYKWCNGTDTSLKKYNNSKYYGSTIDNLPSLSSSDDAARALWGNEWRMPTKGEMEELADNCNWTMCNYNGVIGFIGTSKKSGFTDKFIFIPASGVMVGSKLNSNGAYGYLWSSSLNLDYAPGAHGLWLHSQSNDSYMKSSFRYYGYSIRPVTKK